MNILGYIWFIAGIIWSFAKRPFLEVCTCFLLFAIFEGVNELRLMREEMEDWEEDE